MRKLIAKFNRWFDINLGWFFVNGRKEEAWFKDLRKKYKK